MPDQPDETTLPPAAPGAFPPPRREPPSTTNGQPPNGFPLPTQRPSQQQPPRPLAPLPPPQNTFSSDIRDAAESLGQIARNHAIPEHTPNQGVRRAVYRASGRRINPGLGARQLEELDLIRRINLPFAGWRSVPVLSAKGGIAKTATTLAIGSVLAHYRKDRGVLALDANPDGGSISLRVPQRTDKTIRQLSDDLRQRPLTATEIDSYINYNEQRLGVLCSPLGGAVTSEFGGEDYCHVMSWLTQLFPIVVTDTGTSMVSSVMRGILPMASQAIIVSSTVAEDATVAAFTLDRLSETGFSELASRAVSVITVTTGDERSAKTQAIIRTFAERTRVAVVVPYDEAVRERGVFSLDAVNQKTRLAYLKVAAEVVEGLAGH